jgi:hypothetical protein
MASHIYPAGDRTDFQTTSVESSLAAFDHPLDEVDPSTVHSSLSPSLLQDLLRFSMQEGEIELLYAVAASVRHGKPLSLSLQMGGAPLVASINPRLQIYRAPWNLCALQPSDLVDLRLIRVEPESASVSPAANLRVHVGPLRPLLWRLALFGPRQELLPEIAGSVRYRIAFGLSLAGLPVEPAWMPMLQRLRAMPSSLEELTAGRAPKCAAACRLLNAVYLQSGLMISRAFGAKAR